MNLIKIIKTNVMPILGLGIAAGLTTVSLTSAGSKENTVKPATYIYHLDANGNIGALVEPNPPECSNDNGTYCSLELSAPKPSTMTTVSQAESSPIYVRTNFKNE